MKKKAKIITIVVTIILLIVMSFSLAYYVIWPPIGTPDCYPPTIECAIDGENRTLTVTNVFPGWFEDPQWEDADVSSGSATLPSGNITVGDVITECSDVMTLYWKPCEMEIWTWELV